MLHPSFTNLFDKSSFKWEYVKRKRSKNGKVKKAVKLMFLHNRHISYMTDVVLGKNYYFKVYCAPVACNFYL